MQGLRFPAGTYVRALAQATCPGRENPWAGEDDAALQRRAALVQLLGVRQPRLLLIGEQGHDWDVMRTGVPGLGAMAAELNLGPIRVTPAVSPGVTRFTPETINARQWASLRQWRLADAVVSFDWMPFSGRGKPSDAACGWALQVIRFFPGVPVASFSPWVCARLRSQGIRACEIQADAPLPGLKAA